jgi:hypothetical protein
MEFSRIVLMGMPGEPAISMVNFRVGILLIGTMHYAAIVNWIRAGIIKCKVDPSKLPGGAAAVWDGGSASIFAAKAEGLYADEKQTFIHESTHAVTQLLTATGPGGAMRVKILNSEVAAFLAGSMHVVASGQRASFRDPRSPIAAAYGIVSEKGLRTPQMNVGAQVALSNTEIAPLVTSIRAMPLYSDCNQDVELGRFW